LVSLLAVDMKAPPGCIPAQNAKPTAHGYADRVVHEKTGIEMIFIPAGTFKMGTDDRNASSNPKPARQVTITRPFYIGKTEVTNAQFRGFIKANPGYDGKADVDPNYDHYLLHFRGKSVMSDADEYPVIYVSWQNANAFCDWAGLKLPGEAQWEYACRAGTTTKFSFGDDLADIPKYAWVDLAAKHRTHPVATKLPNPWGLYDMHGNVWEWAADDYISEYHNAPSDETIRRDPNSQTKPLRGGSWSTGPNRSLSRTASWWYSSVLGSVSRFNVAPGNAWHDRGFRVILPLMDIAPIKLQAKAAAPKPVATPVAATSGGAGVLVAHYTFENNVRDISGRGNHGKNLGAEYVKLQSGGHALQFDSSDQSVDLGNRPDFDLRSNLSLEMWINLKSWPTGGEVAIIGKGFNSYLLSCTNQLWFYVNSGSNHVAAPLALNKWHHVVATYDRQMMRLYVNSKQVGEKAWSYPVPQGEHFYLRTPLEGDSAIKGAWSFMLDDVRIYSRVISNSEVASHYKKQNAGRQ
jgi:formylglycine-generating enzyme required for sulfatase activity